LPNANTPINIKFQFRKRFLDEDSMDIDESNSHTNSNNVSTDFYLAHIDNLFSD